MHIVAVIWGILLASAKYSSVIDHARADVGIHGHAHERSSCDCLISRACKIVVNPRAIQGPETDRNFDRQMIQPHHRCISHALMKNQTYTLVLDTLLGTRSVDAASAEALGHVVILCLVSSACKIAARLINRLATKGPQTDRNFDRQTTAFRHRCVSHALMDHQTLYAYLTRTVVLRRLAAHLWHHCLPINTRLGRRINLSCDRHCD